MDKTASRKVFQSLASPLRLDIFCVLVHAGQQGMVAGELADALEVPATNLSFHLKAMLASELVTVQTEGRYQRYRANVAHMLRVLAFLMQNCATGSPAGQCIPARRRRARKGAALPAGKSAT